MQNVEKLEVLCLRYATTTQWLISSSIDVLGHVGSDCSLVPEKFETIKIVNPISGTKIKLQQLKCC